MPTIGELLRQQQAPSQQGLTADRVQAVLAQSVPPSIAASDAMAGNRQQRRDFIDTSGSAFGQAFADRFAGNVANIPDVVANLGARTINQAAEPFQKVAAFGKQMFSGDRPVPGTDVRSAPVSQITPLIRVPTIGQEFVPGPTSSDILGGVQRLGEGAAALRTMNFGQFQPDASAQQQARTELMAQQSPVASILGTISGDVMTMMTARAPIASARGNAQLAAIQAAKLAEKGGTSIALAPTVSAALKSATVNSKATATLLNRVGRIGEAGLEGFTLAALNGQADPLETAAFAAGTQAAGSVLLGGMTGLLSGGPTRAGAKLAISAVAIASLMQIFKAATPAGDNNPTEVLTSLGTGFDKVALGLAAGVLSGAAGMGRVTNRFPVTALPQVADMISSMPRAATLSVLTSMLEDPAAEAVVNKISTDPLYFDPASRRRIERAFIDETVSLSGTIDDLMNNREFRQKFEALK